MRAARERSLSRARCSALERWSRQNRFNGVVARLADPEGSLIDTAQCGVHSLQQLRKRSIGGGRKQSLAQALATVLQFGTQIRLFGGGHTTSDHSLLFCGCAFHPICSYRHRACDSRLKHERTSGLAGRHWLHLMLQGCKASQEFLLQPYNSRGRATKVCGLPCCWYRIQPIVVTSYFYFYV